jgi:hypothetical protein
MNHIGILKPSTLVNLLNAIGIPAVLLYVASMFIIPAVQGEWSWQYVQNVWDRWQSINAAMLALISSIAAFNISRFHANEQREREFSAAKAFLPSALDELCSYFKASATFLMQVWEHLGTDRTAPFEGAVPTPPTDYKAIFSSCIEHADPEVGEYLARILRLIQIHNARIREVAGSMEVGSTMVSSRANIKSYLYRIAELQSLVNKLFPFARSMKPFDRDKLVWEDFRNSYGNLDVWVDEYDGLKGFTERALARHSDL